MSALILFLVTHSTIRNTVQGPSSQTLGFSLTSRGLRLRTILRQDSPDQQMPLHQSRVHEVALWTLLIIEGSLNTVTYHYDRVVYPISVNYTA